MNTPEERASAAAADQEYEAMGEAVQHAHAAGEHWPGWHNIMHREPAAWGKAHEADRAAGDAKRGEREWEAGR